MGKLRKTPDELMRYDLNAIWLAHRGYVDEWDDLTRLMVTANGGKYPPKSETMPKPRKTNNQALSAFLRSRAQQTNTEAQVVNPRPQGYRVPRRRAEATAP